MGNNLNFNDLKTSRNKAVAQFAEHNCKMLHEKKTENYLFNNTRLPENILNQLHGHRLGVTRNWHKTILDKEEELYFRKNKSSENKSYSLGTEFDNLISFIIIEPINKNLSGFLNNDNFQAEKIMTKNGFYLMDKLESVIAVCENDGRVKKLVKYIIH